MSEGWDCFGSGSDSDDANDDAAAAERTRDAENGIMAFHQGTEESMVLFVEKTAPQGDAAAVLAAVDDFCYTKHWMMHVGDVKVRPSRARAARAQSRVEPRL